jgi:tyrosine-protein kinase Etk/Wzc
MATYRRSPNTDVDRVPAEARNPLGLSLLELVENVVIYRFIFLGIFLSCLLIGGVFAMVASPTYSADALIQVEEKKGSAFGSLSTVAKALDIEASPVLGEIDIVRSRTVLTEAIAASGANTVVSVKNTFPVIGSWLATMLPRQPNGLTVQVLPTPFLAWGGEVVIFDAFDVPSDILGEPLELDYPEDGKWLLKNDLGRVLLSGVVGVPHVSGAYKVNVREVVARPGTNFRVVRYSTQTRIEQILKKLSAAETKRQSGVIKLTYEDANPVYAARLVNAIADAYMANNVKRRSGESERSLQFLEGQLPVVKERLQAAEAALNAFRNQERSVDVTGEIKNLLDESAMVERSKFDAKMNYQDLLSKYAPGYPLVVAADAKFKQLDVQSQRLAARIGELPLMQQQYLSLARDVEVNNQLYVGLLSNAQQLRIAKAGTVGNASIADYAVISYKPIRPNRILVVAIGGVIGLILGFVSAQAIALTSGRVRDPKRLEAVVGIQTLGIVPRVIGKEQTETVFVEAIESLVLALQFALAGKRGGKVILVTSAVPDQGKSLLSANLASLFAEKGLKTLLVDADMRRPTIHRYMNVSNVKGLSGVLEGSVKLSEVITELFENLHTLPAGPKAEKVAQLLRDESLYLLMESLRSQYDVVIVDSPPVLPVPDAAALSRHVDLTVFVARQGAVSYSEVAEAIARLGNVGTAVDGLIFNGFEPLLPRYGYYSHAYRYMRSD